MRITAQRHLYVPAKRSEKISKRSEDFAALPHHITENSRRPFWWIMQGGGIK